MTRAKRQADRIRVAVLIAGILYSISAIGCMLWPWVWAVLVQNHDTEFVGLIGTPLVTPIVDNSARNYLFGVFMILGLVLLAQWSFLRPGRGLVPALARHGRPMKSAVIAAAAMGMLLSVGLIALILEIPDVWAPFMERVDRQERTPMLILFGGMGLSWAVWTVIFFAYWRRGDGHTQLTRMIRALVAGSLLEAVVAVPVHIWIMRQRDCYCFRGTYTTLVFSGTVLLWAFGPGIVLLFLREKYRRERLLQRCTYCSYDLTGNVSGVCPECGRKINPLEPAGDN